MEHVGANMGIQIPLLVIDRRTSWHVCMVPEPVGSTHLRFDDSYIMSLCILMDRRLFGVPDVITDMTRSLEMVET